MEKRINENYLKTAVALARMYGVMETLEPLPNIPQDKIYEMICEWTEEYLETTDIDIVTFLHERTKYLK